MDAKQRVAKARAMQAAFAQVTANFTSLVAMGAQPATMRTKEYMDCAIDIKNLMGEIMAQRGFYEQDVLHALGQTPRLVLRKETSKRKVPDASNSKAPAPAFLQLDSVLPGFQAMLRDAQSSWSAKVSDNSPAQLEFEAFTSTSCSPTTTIGKRSKLGTGDNPSPGPTSKHTGVNAVRIVFGHVFSLFLTFRMNRYLKDPSDFPVVVSLSVGGVEEHDDAIARRRHGTGWAIAIDSKFDVFRKVTTEAQLALEHWAHAFRGGGPTMASKAVSR